MLRITIFIALTISIFACGGDPSVSAPTPQTTVSENPWDNTDLTKSDSSLEQDVGNELRDLFIATSDEDTALNDNEKSLRSRSTDFTRERNGPRGGNITISGTRKIDSTDETKYPLTSHTDAVITLERYQTTTNGFHGESQYEGSTIFTSLGNFTRNIKTQGVFYVNKDDKTYELQTQLNLNITSINFIRSGNYTYTVNGNTYSGSF